MTREIIIIITTIVIIIILYFREHVSTHCALNISAVTSKLHTIAVSVRLFVNLRLSTVFYVLLTVHLGIIFVNNQLDAQFFFMHVYFYSIYVSG